MAPEQSSADVTAGRDRERQPLGLWVSILWALSPAAVVLAFLIPLGPRWPYLTWVIFFAGLMNMYAWSAIHLWERGIRHWEIKAVPLTLAMLVVNFIIVIGVDALLRSIW